MMNSFKRDFSIFTHNPQLVYLDSAATSQKPESVMDAVREYYSAYNANIHRGLYPIAEKATAAVEEVRRKVAAFINAKSPEEIIFTKSATEAINLVMYSWGKENIKKNDIIMTTIMEHHANFVPWQILAAEQNAFLDIIDITEEGFLDIEQMMTDSLSAKFLAFSMVSNMLGTINDTSFVKKIKKKNKNIKILVDAAQAAPHAVIDVQKIDCDFLVFSGHKMLAETGIGVLYAKKDLLDTMQPFLYGGDMIREVTREKTTFADIPNKFEAGTINIGGIISLGAAIDYLQGIGMDTVQEHEQQLISYCMEQIKKIDGLTIYGPGSMQRSGLASFTLENIHPHDIAQVLGDGGICIRSGHHCTMPLHKRLGISASARASFYLYNNEEDVEKFIEGLKEVKKIFK